MLVTTRQPVNVNGIDGFLQLVQPRSEHANKRVSEFGFLNNVELLAH